jgi:putative methionine-R-sulfoxide reductase with GAF domain
VPARRTSAATRAHDAASGIPIPDPRHLQRRRHHARAQRLHRARVEARRRRPRAHLGHALHAQRRAHAAQVLQRERRAAPLVRVRQHHQHHRHRVARVHGAQPPLRAVLHARVQHQHVHGLAREERLLRRVVHALPGKVPAVQVQRVAGGGVCGAAAESGETQIVEDVHEFPGHIACDARSESEIVVPVFDGAGKLIAVFDVDSAEKAQFDEADRRGLEAILGAAFGLGVN